MKVNVEDKLISEIEIWIKEGRYKTVEEFVKAAIETLLLAEKFKDSFTKSIKMGSDR